MLRAELALLVILALAGVTYVTRLGGFWVMKMVPVDERTELILRFVSGSAIAALLASFLLRTADPVLWAATAVSAAAMLVTRSTLLAVAGAALTAFVLRSL